MSRDGAMYRNRKLLDAARGQNCLLQIDGVCNGNPETTVAAHSNLLRHGKGRGVKAEDCYTVWACSSCHAWLDQGNASRQEKEEAFLFGFERQVREWFILKIVKV